MVDVKAIKQGLQFLLDEKKVPFDVTQKAIEEGLATAYRRELGKKNQIIRAHINMETGDVSFNQIKIVVDETMVMPPFSKEAHELFLNTATQEEIDAYNNDERTFYDQERNIYLNEARFIRAHAQPGDEIVFELEAPDEEFKRSASQIAKQVFISKIREAEKEIMLEDYEKMIGTLITCTVTRSSKTKVMLETSDQKLAIIPTDEIILQERFAVGDVIKVAILRIETKERSIALIVSRKHKDFIPALLKEQSPEVENGTVVIKGVAREYGSRTKIAVWTDNPSIDPIGACVGQKRARISEVSRELKGEKVDIVLWSEEPGEYIANALAPAKIDGVALDEERHVAHIDVAEGQLSLAIGKLGQNVRLAVHLTGWKINIATDEEIQQNEPENMIDSEDNPILSDDTTQNTDSEL